MTAGDGSWTATAMALREAIGWTASSDCSATATATGTWTGRIATSSGPRSKRAPARPVTSGTSTSTGTATWTARTTGSSTAGSASIEQLRKAAGEVLTAKQAPHRPGTAPALGLRAGRVAVAIVTQTILEQEIQPCDYYLGLT